MISISTCLCWHVCLANVDMEIVNYLLARSAKEELMSSLALFVLKARALKLYRSALRASRSAPKDTRGETPHWHHWKEGILR